MFASPTVLGAVKKPDAQLFAQMVGLYCRWMIPGMLPFVFSLVIMKVWGPSSVWAVQCFAKCLILPAL